MIRPNGQKSLPAIGFLTVTRDLEQGLFGGYLLLNSLGRPLEFHCTAPVRPNRAQEILYGPTLDSYLCGERIGHTLLEKSKAEPQLILTDCFAAIGVRALVNTPVVLLLANESEGSRSLLGAAESGVPERAERGSSAVGHDRMRPFRWENYRLAVHVEYGADAPQFLEQWPAFAPQVELQEPFGRIREAIDEARASAR
jgi:hypothetical protein